jgi:hypothetical protein
MRLSDILRSVQVGLEKQRCFCCPKSSEVFQPGSQRRVYDNIAAQHAAKEQHTMSKIDQFIEVYRVKLKACVAEMPDQYLYSADDANIDKVVGKMREAFVTDTYNISSSPAIRRTCKALGINYTRKAIKAFLAGGEA